MTKFQLGPLHHVGLVVPDLEANPEIIVAFNKHPIRPITQGEMLDGAKPTGSHIPLIWSEDGRAEGDAHYPRGFATTWPKTEMQGINEYKAFTEMKRKEEAGELEQNFVNAAQ